MIRAWLGVVIASTLLIGCGQQQTGDAAPSTPPASDPATAAASPPSRAPDIVGQITQVGDEVMVEEQPEQPMGGNKIAFQLTPTTAIFARNNGNLRQGARADLAIGQQVEAWAAGAILESYPGQATAEAIVITN